MIKNEMIKDIINTKILIIGSGAGGLSAATYAGRGLGEANGVYCLMGGLPGGQLTTTSLVYNFIGYREIDGFELMENCINQSKDAGAILSYEWAQEINFNYDGGFLHQVHTEKNIYISPVIIIATGATHVKLPVEKEAVFKNSGVYYCATCDGPLFKNKTVMVVGGGNTALTEALFLSTICKEVVLVHRRDEFRGEPFLITSVKNKENINIKYFFEIDSLEGQDILKSVIIKNNKTNEKETIKTEAVFVAIGFQPNTKILENTNIELEDFYLKTNPQNMATNIPGVYGVGDVTDKIYRQAVTAAGDGAKAAMNALRYLQSLD